MTSFLTCPSNRCAINFFSFLSTCVVSLKLKMLLNQSCELVALDDSPAGDEITDANGNLVPSIYFLLTREIFEAISFYKLTQNVTILVESIYLFIISRLSSSVKQLYSHQLKNRNCFLTVFIQLINEKNLFLSHQITDETD